MKSFKLVITGTGILMLSILACIQTNTGAEKQVQQQKPAEQQEIAGQQTEAEDGILIYPSCMPATLHYQ